MLLHHLVFLFFMFLLLHHFKVSSSVLSFSRMFLLVGAPKANTTQPGIVEGGQVLKCDWSAHRGCQPIEFDATGKGRSAGPVPQFILVDIFPLLPFRPVGRGGVGSKNACLLRRSFWLVRIKLI